MGRKCSVYGCKTNYKSEEGCGSERKVSVYRLPSDSAERALWISAITNDNFTAKQHTVVCELHWPPGFETISKNGKQRPKHPPSVWPNVPSSQIPTPAPSPRPTKRTSSSLRNTEADQLACFLNSDSVTFCDLQSILLASKSPKRDLLVPVFAFMDDSVVHVQSKKMVNGVPLFVVRISQDLTFVNFHLGVRCTATTLSANKITTLQTWSAFEENIRFLNSLELDNKKKVIQEQLQAMGTQQIGKPVYTPDMIIRAFTYFATSRCLYERLRHDFQFPSVRTLTRITSKVAKLDESAFSSAVFKSLEERQRL
ncbi:hypothetical protein V1264_017922 [Littorina saxatilis]|uniref:THAP-type domain-containing protein n=1 Tax=Littorina saxatilis TaxID=31220 RepID=A0AAN9BJG8_9CAEN